MELIDFIWGEVSYFDESHFKEVEMTFMAKIIDPNTGELLIERAGEIEKCTNELDMVLLLKPYFQWKSIPEAYLTRFEKSNKLSSLLRERANESYKTGNVIKALRGYNLAIAFAPLGSPELGLAFGNRSALFVQLKEPLVAIRDIDSAFDNNFPKHLSDKLIQRRQKCETLLLQNSKDKNLISNSNSMEEVKSFCDENFFTLKSPNLRIPNAENWVDIDFQEDRGRRVIATKNIPAGELILIDKPFVSVINNLLNWDLEHCHFCSKPLLGGIPCHKCTFTFYCDEACRKKSENEGSHKYEHRYLSYLQSICISHRELQAMRIIGIIGPEKLLTMFRNQDLQNVNKTSNIITGFNKNNIYDCSSYIPIYHLISHGMNDKLHKRLSKTFKSIFLIRLLKEHSNFFTDISSQFNSSSEDEINSFETFIASLILRHIDNIRSNAIAISELKQSASGEISVTYATAVYPLISLCNHSCDPNAAPVKKFRFLETALVTLKSLKAGDEIFITYRPLFTQLKTKERQEFLRNNYNFTCQCIACIKDWSPKSIKFSDVFETPRAKCSKCLGKDNSGDKKASNNDDNVILIPCEDCVRQDLKNISELEQLESKLHDADEIIKKGEFVKAIKILKPCLEYFTRNYSSCYSLSQVASDLFKLALVRCVHRAQK